MFAHGNSRIEFWLVTGTLSPSGGGEKEQPNSPAELFSLLSRKIKSSFNPRDPKQEGGGEAARTKDVLYYGWKKCRRSSWRTRRKRY